MKTNRLMIIGLGALALALSACAPLAAPTDPVPAAAVPAAPTPAEEAAPAMEEPVSTITLPDGTVCLFAGEGATLAFDGERLNYTCADPNPPVVGLLGDIQVQSDSGTNVAATLATAVHGDDGFTLDDSQPAAGLITSLRLEDGTDCLWAGEGATLAFDGKRLNYTCGSPELGIIGDLTDAGELQATGELATLVHGDDGFTVESSTMATALVTEIRLEDGLLCRFAGEGATLAFDGARLNYTCDDPNAPIVGLLGDLSADGLTMTVVQATVQHGDDGFTLADSAPVAFVPARYLLADGTECLFAGEGATLAFDGERLNYTCGSPEMGILGDPAVAGLTVTVMEVTTGRSGEEFVIDTRVQVGVTELGSLP
ncbi:MAG: hypothetical protein KDD78_04260 [Caldilineaceae bacterium]|nr:hypothetical protein [Caldilineaceae bacterium]